MYFVDISQNTQRFLDKLDSHISQRIETTLKRLETNPVPSDAKFIGRDKGEKVFRYRVGDYRALYTLNEKEKIILITKIDKRPRVYDWVVIVTWIVLSFLGSRMIKAATSFIRTMVFSRTSGFLLFVIFLLSLIG